jgi:integrase
MVRHISAPARRGGARPIGRTRKESTGNRYHAALSGVFRFALERRWGWIKRNPCRDVERGQEGRGRRRWLSDDERERLLNACRKSEWRGSIRS